MRCARGDGVTRQDCRVAGRTGDRAGVAAHRLGDDVPDGVIAFGAFTDRGTADWQIPAIDPLAVSTIGYTSGTTGYPKGTELTHQAILLNTAMTATMHLRTDRDTVVSALPCSHVYRNIVMNAAIAQGSTLVLHATFDVDRILTSIAAHRATIIEGVPAMYLYLLAAERLARTDITSLTRCTVGGQTMSVATMEQVVAAFGCPLIELWGMTELGGLGTTHAALGPARLGLIGVPLPHCEARIVALDSGETVPAGAIGELQIRGPMVMRGYLNRPDATDQAITAQGWLRTGDLARADPDGFLYLVDRLKDMIITGGFNIYPAELERAIAEHPDVAMVEVGGRADAIKGEVALAYVVRREGRWAMQPRLKRTAVNAWRPTKSRAGSNMSTTCHKPAAEKCCAANCTSRAECCPSSAQGTACRP